MTRIGFLHTAAVHEATFARLVKERDATAEVLHITRPELLARARSHGLEDSVLLAGVAAATADLETGDLDVAVCTCSTIGALVERPAAPNRVAVLRGDRPMARLAIERAGRIAVVATVASTLAPTVELLHEEATKAAVVVDIETKPCLDAWTFFEAGELSAYLQAVAQFVDAIPAEFTSVVLAQASMMDAAALTALPNRVFCSPQSAVDEALRLA
jgi:hypothetical protein